MSGRETPGNVFSDKEGNLFSAVTGNPIGEDGKERAPAQPVAKPEPVDASLDEDDMAVERGMISAGMTPEEIARLRGRSVEQIGKPSVAALSLPTIARELESLAAMKQRDPKKYWSAEVQEKELGLIAARQRLATAKPEAAAVDPEDRGSGAALDPALLAEWREGGGVDHHLGLARATTTTLLAALEAGEADEFSASFDALPAGVQTSIYRHIAVDGGGFSRPATDAQMSDFSALCPEAASLLKGWGSRAARLLGSAHARLDAIEAGMSEADFSQAAAWLRARSPTQRTALMKALAGGAR